MKKLGLILVIAVVGGFVLVKAGVVSAYFFTETQEADGTSHFRCYGDCGPMPAQPVAADMPPAVADAVAVAGTTDSATLATAADEFTRLLRRAHRLRRASGAALMWRRAPGVVRTLDAEQTLLVGRVRAVPMRSRAGLLCRRAAVRFVLRSQWAERRLAAEVASAHRPTWGPVKRFDAAALSTAKSFAGDVRPCLAAASDVERPYVARAMGVS